MDWGLVIHLAAIAATGVGTYAAIKSDLSVLHERTKNTDSKLDRVDHKADKAHERLDRHIEVSHS